MTTNPFTLMRRARQWKDSVRADLSDLKAELDVLRDELTSAQTRIAELEAQRRADVRVPPGHIVWPLLTAPNNEAWPDRILIVRRGKTLRAITASQEQVQVLGLGGWSGDSIVAAIVAGQVTEFELAVLAADGTLGPWTARPAVLKHIATEPTLFRDALNAHAGVADDLQLVASDSEHAFEMTARLLKQTPDLIDFLAAGRKTAAGSVPAPFALPEYLPDFRVPAQPRRRSALFLHHSYYHFNNLAEGLKERGWDAMTVSLENPASPQQQFFHGEDLSLFHADPTQMQRQVAQFFKSVPERFEAMHFYGMGAAALFSDNMEAGQKNTKIPWDFMELRRHNLIIGNMPSGCIEGALPSSFFEVTDGVCSHCVWQLRPDICSEDRNAAWLARLDLVCDWVGLEGDWVTPERKTPRHVFGPAVTALSKDRWRPDLEVPDAFWIARAPDELLVYHAVGNYESRRDQGRDIKGTGAVLAAIDRLKAEGCPIRLFFATDLPSRDVRYYQVQADIVVDQLNYGRLGANARESLMLGRPVITSLKHGRGEKLPYLAEAPVQHADEATIYGELKALVNDPERRRRMSELSRAFALKWHTQEVCAARFETIIDRVRAGLPADPDNALGDVVRTEMLKKHAHA
ncbi:hypothetical protein V5279_31080 [Bradyrhizobium sp. 26S5]|uniref:glycosyltransferase n=1 Tax=Bradyrhizobium sp. 26S5 TaxID=3139729 RepID=UPI0030CBAB08